MSFEEDDLGDLEATRHEGEPETEITLRVEWPSGQTDIFALEDWRLLEDGVLQAKLPDGTIVTFGPEMSWGIKDPHAEVSPP